MKLPYRQKYLAYTFRTYTNLDKDRDMSRVRNILGQKKSSQRYAMMQVAKQLELPAEARSPVIVTTYLDGLMPNEQSTDNQANKRGASLTWNMRSTKECTMSSTLNEFLRFACNASELCDDRSWLWTVRNGNWHDELDPSLKTAVDTVHYKESEDPWTKIERHEQLSTENGKGRRMPGDKKYKSATKLADIVKIS